MCNNEHLNVNFSLCSLSLRGKKEIGDQTVETQVSMRCTFRTFMLVNSTTFFIFNL
jgi:hypothetical protein